MKAPVPKYVFPSISSSFFPHFMWLLLCYYEHRELQYTVEPLFALDTQVGPTTPYVCIYYTIIFCLRQCNELQYRISSKPIFAGCCFCYLHTLMFYMYTQYFILLKKKRNYCFIVSLSDKYFWCNLWLQQTDTQVKWDLCSQWIYL